MVCLERSFEMPASAIGKQEAAEEGIIFENGWGPKRFFQNANGKIGVDFSRCLSLLDENGIFCPTLEDRCCLTLEADSVILAIGQRVDNKGIPLDFLDPKSGSFAADSLTLQSPKEGKIFVCGDCLTGPKSVVESMASGCEAAISADRFMRGQGLRWGRNFWNGAYIKDCVIDLSQARGGPREDLDRIPVDRRDLWTQAEQVLSPERAKREAMRCLSCGRPAEVNHTCWYCLPCEIECPVNALQVRIPYLVR